MSPIRHKGRFTAKLKAKFKCSDCDQAFNHKKLLKEHVMEMHAKEVQTIVATAPSVSIRLPAEESGNDCNFTCAICNHNYKSSKALEKHHVNAHASTWSMKTDEDSAFIGK